MIMLDMEFGQPIHRLREITLALRYAFEEVPQDLADHAGRNFPAVAAQGPITDTQ